MELNYELNPKLMKIAAKQQFSYRHKARRGLQISLGIAALFLASYGLFTDSGQEPFVTVLLILLGIYLLFYKEYYVWRTTRNIFKGIGEKISITLQTQKKHLILKSSRNDNLETPWDNFLDYFFFDQGLLLYPQKDLFYFIPKNATITDGTWEDFVRLVESKVTRRV
jgi:hypothetical protein